MPRTLAHPLPCNRICLDCTPSLTLFHQFFNASVILCLTAVVHCCSSSFCPRSFWGSPFIIVAFSALPSFAFLYRLFSFYCTLVTFHLAMVGPHSLLQLSPCRCRRSLVINAVSSAPPVLNLHHHYVVSAARPHSS